MPKKTTVTIINPYAKTSGWFPEPYQLLQYPNENRLNSLWLGLVAPFVMLPGRLWNEVLRVLLAGHPLSALKNLLWMIPHTSLLWMKWGIRGHAYVVYATMDQLWGARFLKPHESVIAAIKDFPQIAEVSIT